jgi:hypothetical protein
VFFTPDKLQAVFQALDKWEERGISPGAMMQAVCLAGPDGPVSTSFLPLRRGSVSIMSMLPGMEVWPESDCSDEGMGERETSARD